MLLSVKAGWMMVWAFGGHFLGPTETHALFPTEAECLHALDAKQRAAHHATRPRPHLVEERHPEPFHGVVWLWACLPRDSEENEYNYYGR